MDDKNFQAEMERSVNRRLAQMLTADELALWEKCKFIGRFFLDAADSLGMLVRHGDPRRTDQVATFECAKLEASFQEGVMVTLVRPATGELFEVTHMPKQFKPYPLFLWVPAYDCVGLQGGAKGSLRPGVSLAFKALHAPDYRTKEPTVFLKKLTSAGV